MSEHPMTQDIKLPPISDEDRQFLHDNPNTSDLVEWVQAYATVADRDIQQELLWEVDYFLSSLDDYPERLVPINRDSGMIRALRRAAAAIRQGSESKG